MMKQFKRLLVSCLASGLFAATASASVALPSNYTLLDYIESSGTQYIDTGVPASSGYKFDFDLMNVDSGNDKCVMGYKNSADAMQMVLPLHYYNGWGYALGRGGQWSGNKEPRNERQTVHSELLAGSQKLVVNGTPTMTTTLGATSYSGKTLYLFANNQQGTGMSLAMKLRLYSCQISTADDQPVRDFVPTRLADGSIGLFDLANGGKFYGNKGAGDFKWGGIAYNVDGTTLKIHEGVLAADDLAGYAAVEKVNRYTLDASSVTAYDVPLTLSKGVFSLADGSVRPITVNGGLAFAGGAMLKIDANASACDSFTASSLDLSGATTANPFVIDIANDDADMGWLSSKTLTLVTGIGLEDGVCGNIRVTQSGPENLEAAVKDGNLIIRLKSVPRATWTGAKNGDLADTGNWEYFDEYDVKQDRVPDANTDVYFKGSKIPDITGSATLEARSLLLSATLGRDCDWSALPSTIPVSGTIDLKGSNLTVANFPSTWDAAITDSNGTEYELLDSIANVDASQNWIDTGVLATPTMRAEYDLKWDDAIANVDKYVCGNDVTYRACAFVWSTPTAYWFRTGTGASQTKVGTPTNTRRVIVFDMKNTKGLVYESDGTLHASGNLTPGTSSARYSMYALSARTKADDSVAPANFGKQTLYGVKFYENNELTHRFVPARRLSDQTLGLLDMVNPSAANAFKAKKGSGTLSAGSATNVFHAGAAAGEVHVISNVNIENNSVTLSGALKLVKEGTGTFTASKAGQTYTGGTEVKSGALVVSPGSELADMRLGLVNGVVVVDADATLELGGNTAFDAHPLVLNGGTVQNSSGTATIGAVTLTDDSAVNAASGIMVSGQVELGGFTLTETTGDGKTFVLADGARLVNGKVNVSGGGWFKPTGAAKDMTTVDFTVGGALDIDADISVRDWTVVADASTFASGSKHVYIGGTYTPTTDYMCNFMLSDGSTLNLADKSEVWAIGGLWFADNAAVTVVPGRKNGKLVSWTTVPDDVKFVLDKASGRIETMPDGLYLRTGLAIIIR